jgi:hypothetical protein
MPKPSPVGVLWVASDVTPDGDYVVTVQAGDDFALPLGHERGIRYAVAVLAAAQYADYEAAVFAQLAAAKLPGDLALFALAELRNARPAIDPEATAPLGFEALLSSTTRRGLVKVMLHGRQIAQLETAAAAQHAQDVLSLLVAVDLDAAYYGWLMSGVVDEPTARRTVHDLAQWRRKATGARPTGS